MNNKYLKKISKNLINISFKKNMISLDIVLKIIKIIFKNFSFKQFNIIIKNYIKFLIIYAKKYEVFIEYDGIINNKLIKILLSKIKDIFFKNQYCKFHLKKNKDLMAGFCIYFNDMQIDASLRAKIKNLKYR